MTHLPIHNYTCCIAENFCVDRDNDTVVMLECEIPNDPSNPPTPQPLPLQSWFKDGELVYTAPLGTIPDIEDFVMDKQVLMPGVLDPTTFTADGDGTISYSTVVMNISIPVFLPPNTTIEQARQMLFDLLLGNWTCVANNSLGTSSVTHIVRECGEYW